MAHGMNAVDGWRVCSLRKHHINCCVCVGKWSSSLLENHSVSPVRGMHSNVIWTGREGNCGIYRSQIYSIYRTVLPGAVGSFPLLAWMQVTKYIWSTGQSLGLEFGMVFSVNWRARGKRYLWVNDNICQERNQKECNIRLNFRRLKL